MQIEEFSHLTGKLVFGFLLVILIYYELFLVRQKRIEDQIAFIFLRKFGMTERANRLKFMQNMASLQNRFIVDDSGKMEKLIARNLIREGNSPFLPLL
jgi:hypothetical protein